MINNEVDNKTGINQAGKRANNPLKLLTASSLRGNKVFNNGNEALGEVMDLMLNVDDATIHYVIISFGGFIGLGEKYFAVPFESFAVDQDRHALILNQSRESFIEMPGFDKDHWPESNSHFQKATHGGGFMAPNTGSDH